MSSMLKKITVLLPVVLFGLFFFRDWYPEAYAQVSLKRTSGFVLSVLLLYALFIFAVIRSKQEGFFAGLVQSSFFVYVFAVLTLTGYFVLFKEISSHDWWGRMEQRVETKDRVNLQPFQLFRIYSTRHKQVLGNLIMLLPLGIYLPLLYRRLRSFGGFFTVLLISLLVSLGIELLQLITSYRSADIDDVILNTIGGCLGFIIYQFIRAVAGRKS